MARSRLTTTPPARRARRRAPAPRRAPAARRRASARWPARAATRRRGGTSRARWAIVGDRRAKLCSCCSVNQMSKFGPTCSSSTNVSTRVLRPVRRGVEVDDARAVVAQADLHLERLVRRIDGEREDVAVLPVRGAAKRRADSPSPVTENVSGTAGLPRVPTRMYATSLCSSIVALFMQAVLALLHRDDDRLEERRRLGVRRRQQPVLAQERQVDDEADDGGADQRGDERDPLSHGSAPPGRRTRRSAGRASRTGAPTRRQA